MESVVSISYALIFRGMFFVSGKRPFETAVSMKERTLPWWCSSADANIFHHHQPAVFQILPSSLYSFRFWSRLTPLFILYFNQKSNLQRINFLHTPFNDSNIRINSNKSWSTRWIPSSISQYLLAYSIYSRNNTTFPSRLPSSIQLNLRTHTFCQCYPFLTCSFKYGKPLSEKMKLLSLLMCEELVVEYRQFMHDRVGH